jgi:hypothetical protein
VFLIVRHSYPGLIFVGKVWSLSQDLNTCSSLVANVMLIMIVSNRYKRSSLLLKGVSVRQKSFYKIWWAWRKEEVTDRVLQNVQKNVFGDLKFLNCWGRFYIITLCQFIHKTFYSRN